MSEKERSGERAASTGLVHPGWWAALFVLVVNDHWLKGSQLPGWMTGKLSDFAGMVVAPVLLAALLAGNHAGLRALCFAAVAVPFAAINVSTAAAECLTLVLGRVGVPWRIWTDPTDWIAFVMLPVAWSIATAPSRTLPESWCPRVAKLGVLVGGISCIATSYPYQKVETAAYLVNSTREKLSAEMYRPRELLDCEGLRAAPAEGLSPQAFELDTCKSFWPRSVISLDAEWRDVSNEMAPPPEALRPCDAAVVRIPGAPLTLFFWESEPKVAVGVPADLEEARQDSHSVLLEPFGAERVFAPGESVRAWTVDWTFPDSVSECEEGP